MRKKITNNVMNTILQSYWGVSLGFDLGHIPYFKKDYFVEKGEKYQYFTYSRCPYDRLISAFFYLHPKKSKDDLQIFIKYTLPLLNFSLAYDCNIIHYYPQYLFVCDENLQLSKDIHIQKLENVEKPKQYILEDYLDTQSIAIINHIYNKDFAWFNYSMMPTT